MFSCFFSSRQPHQCNCSSKVTGFGQAWAFGFLQDREQPLHLPLLLPAPWLKQDWFRDLSFMELEGERLFLAGAKVQVFAGAGGGGGRRGGEGQGLLLASVLPPGL